MFAVAHALTRTHDTTPPHQLRLNDHHDPVIDVFDPVSGFLRSQLERNVRIAHVKPPGCPVCQQRRIDGTWRALRAWERFAVRDSERSACFYEWYATLPKPDGHCPHLASDYGVRGKDEDPDRRRAGDLGRRKTELQRVTRQLVERARWSYEEAAQREASRKEGRETAEKRTALPPPSPSPTAVQSLRRDRPEGGFSLHLVKPHPRFTGTLPVETGVQDLIELPLWRKLIAPGSGVRKQAGGMVQQLGKARDKQCAAQQLLAHAEAQVARIQADPPVLATVWSSTDTDWLRQVRDAVVEEMLYLEDEQRETHDGYSLVGLPYNPQADAVPGKGERKQVFRSAFGDGSPAAFLEDGELEHLVEERIDEIREFTADSDRDEEDYVYMAIGAGSVLHDAEAGLAFGAFDISLKPFFEPVEDRYEAGSMQSSHDDLDGDRGSPGLYEARTADVWASGLRAGRHQAQRAAAATTTPTQLELLRIVHRRLDIWIGTIEEYEANQGYDWALVHHDHPLSWLKAFEPTSPLLRLPMWAQLHEENNDEATAVEVVDGEDAVEVYG